MVDSGARPAELGLPALALDGSCIGVSSPMSNTPGCEGPGVPGSGPACIVLMYGASGVS